MQAQGLADSLERDRDRRLMVERPIADLDVPSENPAGATAIVAGHRRCRRRRRARPPPSSTPRARTCASLQHAIQAGAPRRDARRAHGPRAGAQARARTRGDGGRARTRPAASAGGRLSAAERRVRDLRSGTRPPSTTIRAKEEEAGDAVRVNWLSYRSRLDAVPVRESELAELTRDYRRCRTVYTSLLQKNEESQIAAQPRKRQIGEQFKVLDPARTARTPVQPRSARRCYLVGPLAAWSSGSAPPRSWNILDRTLRTEADVRRRLEPAGARDGAAMRNADRAPPAIGRVVRSLAGAAVAGCRRGIAVAWSC